MCTPSGAEDTEDARVADSFVGHDGLTGEQQLLYIMVAEAEAKVQPDAMAEDLGGKPMVCIRAEWSCGVHGRSQDDLLV